MAADTTLHVVSRAVLDGGGAVVDYYRGRGGAIIPYRPDVLPSDDWEAACRKAIDLLLSVLPQEQSLEFSGWGYFSVLGKSGMRYFISPYTQTVARNDKGEIQYYACLQLEEYCPAYDRMLAEYLMIKNDEPLYLRTANLFAVRAVGMGLAERFVLSFNIVMVVILILRFIWGF